jgi:uncharacterized protein YbbK (DUF523 family)
MVNWALKRVNQLEKEDICGFIFKSNSPSCGIRKVKFFNKKHMHLKEGKGIFAKIFIEHFPLLPVEDEELLNDPAMFKNFTESIFTFAKSCAK